MKLLHICAIGFTVKNLLLPQIQHFLERGLQVEVACSPGSEVEELQQRGYIVHPVPIDRRIAPASNLRSVMQLARLMRRQRYDAVHVHTPIASVLGRFAAKLAGISRILYTAHGFYFHDEMPRRTYRFYHSIERAAGWLTDLILTQSREDLVTAEKSDLCPARKLRYLGNGVDIGRFRRDRLSPSHQTQLRYDLRIPADVFPLLGMTGRITAEKGYAELITALAQLRQQFPQACLLVIGGQLSSERDAFQSELRDRIQQQNLASQVIFTGFRSDIPELLGLLDIFCLPSYREGLPRSILEAMAMELPIVTTDIRGCREAVRHGQTGLIVPPRQSQPLAAALQQLATHAEQRQKLGLAGRDRVEAEFDEQLVFQRLAAAYRDLGIL
ncbi:MAG: glycosyltransferase family 4 protein [Spirulinaceae cyanobacterium SM2_1_0]|nr:glycosyltransferase family 4 protein [Spirulinaceae cyanobacterium SM2_1_0]